MHAQLLVFAEGRKDGEKGNAILGKGGGRLERKKRNLATHQNQEPTCLGKNTLDNVLLVE